MHTMKRHKSVEGAKILLVMSQRVQRPSWRDIEAKQRTGWQQKYVLLILPAHVTRFSEWFCKSSKNSPLQTKREQMHGWDVCRASVAALKTKGSPPEKKDVFFWALPKLPPPPSLHFRQLVHLRTSKTTFCAYDRKIPIMIMMVAMIVMMVILMIMMTKITK